MWSERSIFLDEIGVAIRNDSSIAAASQEIDQAVLYLSTGDWQGNKDDLAKRVTRMQGLATVDALESHHKIPSQSIEELGSQEFTFVHGRDRITIGTYIPGSLVVDRFSMVYGFIEAELALDHATKGFRRGMNGADIDRIRYTVDVWRGTDFTMALAHVLAPLSYPTGNSNVTEYYMGSGVPHVKVTEVDERRSRYAMYPYLNFGVLMDVLDPREEGYMPPFSRGDLLVRQGKLMAV